LQAGAQTSEHFAATAHLASRPSQTRTVKAAARFRFLHHIEVVIELATSKTWVCASRISCASAVRWRSRTNIQTDLHLCRCSISKSGSATLAKQAPHFVECQNVDLAASRASPFDWRVRSAAA